MNHIYKIFEQTDLFVFQLKIVENIILKAKFQEQIQGKIKRKDNI